MFAIVGSYQIYTSTMKVALVALSEKDFNQILIRQNNDLLRGSGIDDINIFRSKRYLRGSGFLDFIRGVGNFLMPLAKKYIQPSLTGFAHGMVQDISEGKNIKSSLKNRSKKSMKEIGTRILKGKGIKKANRLHKSKSRRGRSTRSTKRKKAKKIVSGCGHKKSKPSNRKRKLKQSTKKNNKKSKKVHVDIFS